MGSGGSQSRRGSSRIRERTSWPPSRSLASPFPRRHAQRERLGAWIHMVEVQIDHAAVVSADRAAAACLGDKDSLDLLKAARDCFSDAALAAPSDSSLALAVAMEHHKAMRGGQWRNVAVLSALGGRPFLRDQRHRRYGFCAWHERMFATMPDARNAIMRAGPLAQMAERGTSTQRSASRETASWSAAVCWDPLRASGTEA